LTKEEWMMGLMKTEEDCGILCFLLVGGEIDDCIRVEKIAWDIDPRLFFHFGCLSRR
jgi:hypothetical protein